MAWSGRAGPPDRSTGGRSAPHRDPQAGLRAVLDRGADPPRRDHAAQRQLAAVLKPSDRTAEITEITENHDSISVTSVASAVDHPAFRRRLIGAGCQVSDRNVNADAARLSFPIAPAARADRGSAGTYR